MEHQTHRFNDIPVRVNPDNTELIEALRHFAEQRIEKALGEIAFLDSLVHQSEQLDFGLSDGAV